MNRPTAQARSFRACAVFVLVGCSGAPPDDTGALPAAAQPSITAATVSCEPADAEWSFDVVTSAWTGNGQLLLSADGEYVEKHPLYSIGAAADGSRDELALTLGVVPDWRDVMLGSSTWFNCGTASLTGILRVFTRDGAAEADCRAFGEAPERWAEWDVGATCATVLAAPE